MTPLIRDMTITEQYYMKTGDGDTDYLLAGVGIPSSKSADMESKSQNDIDYLPPMDGYVHAGFYAQRLLPRAVGYSASLLDYFFRGALFLEPVSDGISFNSVKVRAQKVMPSSEATAPGEVALVIRYKRLDEIAQSGGRSILNYPTNNEYS